MASNTLLERPAVSVATDPDILAAAARLNGEDMCSIADVARNVERWVDVIVLRTYAHDTITEMAANSRVPVINALSDFEHPCQALADFMTLQEHFGNIKGLNFTYVGDGDNVCHSLMLTGAQLGVNLTVATPRGYSPDIEIVTDRKSTRLNSVTA